MRCDAMRCAVALWLFAELIDYIYIYIFFFEFFFLKVMFLHQAWSTLASENIFSLFSETEWEETLAIWMWCDVTWRLFGDSGSSVIKISMLKKKRKGKKRKERRKKRQTTPSLFPGFLKEMKETPMCALKALDWLRSSRNLQDVHGDFILF